MPLHHIQHVFMFRPGPDGKMNRHRAGRFLTAGGHLHILEDYHNLLGRHLREGPLTMDHFNQIHGMANSQYLDLVSERDLQEGKRPDLMPEAELEPKPPRPNPSFDYQHQGDARPNHVEFREGIPHFDGVPTTHTHIRALLDNARTGLARVRYRQDKGQVVKKMEWLLLEILAKAKHIDTDKLNEAFGRLRDLVQAGHLDPDHHRALADFVYKDPMIPEIGNKFSYEDFKKRPREGVHVAMDSNDLKSINDRYGHAVGDEAIKAMGRAARESMDEVAPEQGKVWRFGGDEFAAHLPSHEHAAQFARSLRTKLEQIPAIQGSHRLSMSFGLGNDPETADQALYLAKRQKYHPESIVGPDSRTWQPKYEKGAAPSMAHSLVPGFEGSIPLDESHLQVRPPPPPPVKEPKPGSNPAGSAPATPATAAIIPSGQSERATSEMPEGIQPPSRVS